ncbi:hypothetical protein EJ02DRAFT_247061 [Clathrospora elynae]|uniref:Mid2 domain-containing protein n=1 Tax=Clathrospora elynae TaxID=706981 RepID=A0A6A5SRP2_9PLEO|nr:hypothetical protein EJ02DRAFT_247061 [Clathrospora elynae]
MSSNATETAAPSSNAPAPAPASSASPVSLPPAASSAAAPAPAPSSAAPPASSAPPPTPSSAAPAPQPSSEPPATTQVIMASSDAPSTMDVQTSLIMVTQEPSRPGETPNVILITSVITRTNNAAAPTATGSRTGTGSARPSSTDPTQLQNSQNETTNGLGTGGKTAIAVVIPVVVVALLVLGGIFFWRKRKQRKSAEDERRKEVEEYGYNPNHDPTLPAVGGLQMAEDDSGYRGWGNTTTSSNRKASTTLTSGMAYSDSNSNPGGYGSPSSPTNGAHSEVHSNDPLVDGRRETLDSDGIGALGVVNGASASNSAQHQAGVHRGPSNASSSYSAANHSDNSGDYPGMSAGVSPEYHQDYYQNGPYNGNDPYAAQQQPIIRDVSARRNTRIENPSVFPQQGNSGIAQNF